MWLVEYLFHRPGPIGPVFGRWGLILAGVYAGLLLALLVLGYVLRAFSEGHELNTRITRRILRYGVPLQLTGLLFLWLRWINFPGLSMRVLLLAHLALHVAAIGYLVWWMRLKYWDEIAYFEWEDQKRDYLPRPTRGRRGRARARA